MDSGVVCAKDGVETRLRCADCDTGICPACLVATPVGYKCGACAGAQAGHRAGSRRPVTVMLAGGAVVLLLVGVVLTRSPGPRAPAAPDVAGQTAAVDAPPTQEPMIGEEARDGQLSFVVDDFSCGAGADGAGRPAAGKLCRLAVTVTNTSGSPAMFLGQFQYLLDAQSRTYGADDQLTRAVPENGNRSITQLNINPQIVVPLVLVFDVPDSVEPTEAQFKGTGRSRLGVDVRLQRRS